MKRKSSKFLCSLVALIMVLASTGTAFAAGSSAEGAVIGNTVESIDVGSLLNAAEADTLGAVVQGDIVVNYMETGAEDIVQSVITYDGVNNLLDEQDSYHYMGYSKQVWLEKGTVTMIAAAENPTGDAMAYYGVFTDQALVNVVDSIGIVSEEDGADINVFQIPASGYYWIGAYSYASDPTEDICTVTLAPLNFSDADRDIYNGKPIAVGQKSSGQVNYFKFKAVNTGYLIAEGSLDNKYYMTLLNSNKKALSSKSSSDNQIAWAVKKGKTYYIKVEALYSSYDAGGYVFSIENKKVAEKSGASKAKAVSIKKGKTVKGTIIAGEGKADWYKFTVTKTKKVKIDIKGDTNDQIKVVVYDGSRNMGSTTLSYYSGQRTLESIGKLSKGTYHIKVYRGNNKSSGYYSLKWK